MANQELVAYLRKNWNQYGPDALRHKLLDEGLDENEVNAAMAEAAPKIKVKTRKPVYLIIAAALLIAFVVWISQNSSQDTEEKSLTSKPTPVQENPNDTHQAFIGHYGYVIRLPSGYEALSDFKDPDKTIERVYFFPKGTDLSNLQDEKLYGPLGILRLEVSPRTIPSGRNGLVVVRSQVSAQLQQSKEPFALRETMVDGLQALIASTQGPIPQVRTIVIGSKVLYVLTSGDENEVFSNTLSSLHELSPNNKPGSP